MTDLREAIARELVDLDDLLSLIDDAISESLDMDWQTMWGAKAVVGALEHQGWVVLPASALTAALGREEALRVALRDIVDPISRMQREADKVGAILDGASAVRIADNPEYLRGIARAALENTNGK